MGRMALAKSIICCSEGLKKFSATSCTSVRDSSTASSCRELKYWVLVKELNLSYNNKETMVLGTQSPIIESTCEEGECGNPKTCYLKTSAAFMSGLNG